MAVLEMQPSHDGKELLIRGKSGNSDFDTLLRTMTKEEVLPFVTTWRALEHVILNEISQTGKDKYCMVSSTWRIVKKSNYEKRE